MSRKNLMRTTQRCCILLPDKTAAGWLLISHLINHRSKSNETYWYCRWNVIKRVFFSTKTLFFHRCFSAWTPLSKNSAVNLTSSCELFSLPSYIYIYIYIYIYALPRVLSTLAKEFMAATRIMPSSSNELGTLVSGKVQM